MPEHRPPCLEVRGLTGYYGETQALHGMEFVVHPGEVVCLLGRNGAGKTTTLRAVMGLLTRRHGHIAIHGQSTEGLMPEDIARLGVAYCPEERGIFASLDVEENLLLPPVLMPGGMSLDEIFTLFPNLKQRLRSPGHAGDESGGECGQGRDTQERCAHGRGLTSCRCGGWCPGRSRRAGSGCGSAARCLPCGSCPGTTRCPPPTGCCS